MNKKVLSIFVITLIVLACLAFTSAGFASPTDKVPVIIGFKGASDAALVNAHGGEITYQYQYISAIAASVPPQAVAALQKNPNVAYVESDFQVQALDRPTPKPSPTSSPTPTPTPTPSPQTTPWGISQIKAPDVWTNNDEITIKGQNVKVAVLDTGIYTSHPDLNVVGGVSFVRGARSYNDDNGHGTHCAGTIAALDNNIGVVGVAPSASLYAVKVLDRTGNGYLSWVISGIEWSITNNMQVISMSLGSSSGSTSLQQSCDNAYSHNIVVVAAAGNTGPNENTINYPAQYSSVIAVGATDNTNTIASFSSRGSQLSVVAPGVDITSTFPPTIPIQGKTGYYYAIGSGTSMACPHVAGTVALMLSNGISPTNVRNNLETTADLCLGQTGFDSNYGHGLVNAFKACGFTQP
jgi:subtilisin